MEHIGTGNSVTHTGRKLDRKVRVAPDFKLKQDVMRTSWRKVSFPVNTTNVGVPRASYL